MQEMESQPFLVVTVLVDGSARPAALTRSLGDAMERAITASSGQKIAGLDVVELTISAQAFGELRASLSLGEDTVAMYDLFPISSALDPKLRKVAGQFLAAERLWQLEEQGMLRGAPAHERFDLPKGWPKSPKEIREKLEQAGAPNLSEAAISTYHGVKAKWDSLA